MLVTIVAVAALAQGSAAARPLQHVVTAPSVCAHGTAATWRVAYETFGSATFHGLHGQVAHQRTPGRGRPDAALRRTLQTTADEFGAASRCSVGLRFDVYWAPSHDLVVNQEPYSRLRASRLPLPTPVGGGPQRASQFFSRYDSVMEQFSATRGDGTPLLGFGFEGETFGYVSLIDSLAAPSSPLLTYELLQGMTRFFTTRGAHIAPNPSTGMDAYCPALHRLGYHDVVRVSSATCTSNRYARDVIAGTVPVYHGISHRLWRHDSVSRSWRRHHTLPAGLPAGHGRISSGAGPH